MRVLPSLTGRAHLGAAALALTALLVAVSAGPVSAHVTVTSPGAVAGASAPLQFRVPNERSDESTVRVELTLPEDAPIPGVLIRPRPGWTYETETQKLPEPLEIEGQRTTETVQRIVWRAQGAGIRPGEFEMFEIFAGALPDQRTLTFPVLQTYSGGEVVRWTQQPVADGPAPEQPAPLLRLTDPSPNVEAPATSPWQPLALGLGALALLVGVGALVVSARGRRPSS